MTATEIATASNFSVFFIRMISSVLSCITHFWVRTIHKTCYFAVVRIAAIQMTSGKDKSANLAEAHRLLLEALDRKAEFVAFPENFSLQTDQSRQFFSEAEVARGSMTVETLQEWAAEYDVWIVGGTISLKTKDEKKVRQSSLLISPEGEIVARYDKIHLFDADVPGDQKYHESKWVEPGKKAVTADTPLGKVGLTVCYDLRFPELYRVLSRDQVPVIFVPSAFTAVTGKAHWDTLTRARAIENLSYIVAPAQTGSPYPGRQTYGHTRIVDPWGRVLAERPAGPGVVWADISLEKIAQVRKEFPVLNHRRLF